MTERADAGSAGAARGPRLASTATRPRGEALLRGLVFLIVGTFLLLPLLAMLDFSTRGMRGSRTIEPWLQIGTNPDLVDAIVLSLELAGLTVALMLLLLVPTVIWVRLRLPALLRVIEFICLLPLTIPAIVLVVGLAPVYSWVAPLFGESPLSLTFVYTVLVLPYAYRALATGLAAIDVVTLAEAGRSLGCSWPGVIWWIVVPNIRGALLSAALISVALVLGEFTISSLLNFNTLQVVINLIGKRDASVAVAVSLAALCLAFTLLLLLSVFDRYSRRRPAGEEAR
jgi:putative spermidine/putrescine transport system permease protein